LITVYINPYTVWAGDPRSLRETPVAERTENGTDRREGISQESGSSVPLNDFGFMIN